MIYLGKFTIARNLYFFITLTLDSMIKIVKKKNIPVNLMSDIMYFRGVCILFKCSLAMYL